MPKDECWTCSSRCHATADCPSRIRPNMTKEDGNGGDGINLFGWLSWAASVVVDGAAEVAEGMAQAWTQVAKRSSTVVEFTVFCLATAWLEFFQPGKWGTKWDHEHGVDGSVVGHFSWSELEWVRRWGYTGLAWLT